MYKESIKSTANARAIGIGIPKQFYEEARKTKGFDYTAYLSVDCMLEIILSFGKFCIFSTFIPANSLMAFFSKGLIVTIIIE